MSQGVSNMPQHMGGQMANRESSSFMPVLLCTAGAAAFFGVSILMQQLDFGRGAFACALLMVACFSLALWFGVIRHESRSFALQAGFGAIFVRILLPVATCFTLPLDEDYVYPYSEYLFASPFRAASGFLFYPLAITAVVLLLRLIPTRPSSRTTFRELILRMGPRFEMFLIIAAGLRVVQWVAVLFTGNLVFYAIRILNGALYFAPFVAGYAASRFKRATVLWLIVLALGVVLSFATGSRGMAFIPIIFYLAGYLFGLPSKRERIVKLVFYVCPVALVCVVIGAYIGAMRDVVGRMSVEEMFSEGSLRSQTSDSFVGAEVESQLDEGFAFKALRRLSPWVYPVIPAMTPDPIQYRGYDDIGVEISAAFALGMIKGEYNTGGVYFSNWYLKPYGFAVHADQYEKISNVEMPVSVDGFTRGGWVGAFVASFITFAFIAIVELFMRSKFMHWNKFIFIVLLVVLCNSSAIRVSTDPMVDVIRFTILTISFCGGLFFLMHLLANRLGIRREHNW